ncbi:related to transcription activator protein acu-15 [Phialocephala subalpina]|uniref:Related to transcription activator protein acu-15 n=1 Tax=Phialocephala subalpina TaxID=576137 RepID=A0A1L7X1J7_9HELO|nr:related to transcription activator protein acu-15 [Phialocephala subalpina]
MFMTWAWLHPKVRPQFEPLHRPPPECLSQTSSTRFSRARAIMNNFIGKFRAHKTGSPSQDPSGKVTKRPRESLVCYQCRKSKLRCDRGQPCSSCGRRGEGEACSYRQPPILRLDSNLHAAAEDRLLRLESTVRQLMQTQASPQTSFQSDNGVLPARPVAPATPNLPREPALGLDQLQGEQVDARYVGSTHWMAVLDDIQGLKVLLDSPADIEKAEDPVAFEPSYSGSELIFGTSLGYDIQTILSQSLPPRVEVDRSIALYFRGETFIIPFVHTFCFQRQYQEFWTDTANINPLWLSMLFSICCLASLTGEHRSSQDDLVSRRSIFHEAAAKCLVAGQYHRPQEFAVEALAMYAHCKNLRTLDPSREAGALLGTVIRMAYERGYHRDADSFGTLSVFEAEMRRRFWAAVKQMDLMASFQLGLPSNITLEQCDTKSPRNLLDSDFDEDTQILPASRSENEPSRLLWFIVKDRQMVSFGKVCQDVLSLKEKSESEILQLDDEIRQMHEMTPHVLQTRPLSESITDPAYLVMTRIYVEFIYLKSLCALHRRYMARGNAFSTRTCVDAGKKLVSQFIDMYKEFSPGGQLHAERWMLTNFTMNDFMLGIMVLCLVVHLRRKRGHQNPIIDTATENEALALLEQSHPICMEKSTVSRDALRVSHAIHLTLNNSRLSNAATNTSLPNSPAFPGTSPDANVAAGDVHGVNHASLLLNSRNGHIQGDEAAFGFLDPFNFMGNDIENIDWTMFNLPDPSSMNGPSQI